MAYNEAQLKTMFDAPIPGESLTSDPENPAAYEKPPQYTDLQRFIDDMFLKLTDEENIDGILDPLRKGIPVEDVAQVILFQAFSSGKVNTDLHLLAIEPTIYLLIGIGQMAGIEDMVLYPEESFDLDEQEQAKLLTEDGQRIEEGSKAPEISEIKAPKGVSKSLIDKLTQENKENV